MQQVRTDLLTSEDPIPRTCRFYIEDPSISNHGEGVCCDKAVLKPNATRGNAGSYCAEHFAVVSVPNTAIAKPRGPMLSLQTRKSFEEHLWGGFDRASW